MISTRPTRRQFLQRLAGLAPAVALVACNDSRNSGDSTSAASTPASSSAAAPAPATTPPVTLPATNPTPAPTPTQRTGLLFPGDFDANRRFRRVLPADTIPDPYPLTVVFQIRPEDKGVTYQTIFFHGVEGDYFANNEKFYGCDPYPLDGEEMRWAISANARDITGDPVEYGRWQDCAFVAWADDAGKHHSFYYDLPDTSKVITYDLPPEYFSSQASTQSFTWGDAPWDHVTNQSGKEQFKGALRRLKIFSTNLSLADLLVEGQMDELATDAGRNSVWYLNANPTPEDITDKSGKGHDFSWFDPTNTASIWKAS